MKVLALILFFGAACGLPQWSRSAPPQHFYFSWSGNLSEPNPVLTAERSDNKVRWFENTPRAHSKQEIDFGAYLPKDFLLVLRYKETDGTHLGEASSYRCFLFFCSWISGSILSGLPSNDLVSYRIKSGQIWFEKAPFDAFPGFRLRGGANVVSAKLSVAGTGLEQSESGIVPLPLIGLALTKEMFWKLSFLAEANYSRLEKRQTGGAFRDAAIGMSARLFDNLSVAAGVRKNVIDIWYQKDNVSAALSIPQTTPFLTITISY